MAKWNVGMNSEGSTMLGSIDYDNSGSRWNISQDVGAIKAQAKLDRESGDGKSHYTKMYSIPEVVAIEIKGIHGIDVFSPEFLHDKEMKTKVHLLMQRDYKHLLSTDKLL